LLKPEKEEFEEEGQEDGVTESPAAATADVEPVMREMSEEDLQREAELLAKMSAQQIRLILEDVCTEMLSGLEVVACSLLICTECPPGPFPQRVSPFQICSQ